MSAITATQEDRAVIVHRAVNSVKKDWVLWLGGALLSVLILLALFPGWISPYDPTALIGRPFAAPGTNFWLGTNDIGQDLFSELIWGTRISLFTGLAVGLLSVGIGLAAGVVSGYLSGWVESAVMRLVDLTLALPFLPLVILISAYLGPSQRNVILILALVSWAGPARIIRSRVVTMRNEQFVMAARALGGSPLHIMAKHIWLGVRPLVLIQFVLVASVSILAEAGLSFLGLGDPAVKSWGTMLYFARASGAFLGEAWQWWVLPTGLMISLSVLSLALIGYGIESRLVHHR